MRSARPLRLAFIARRFGAQFGGAEAYAEYLLDVLRHTHEVHVFCQEWNSPIPVGHTLVPKMESLPRWLNLIDFSRRCQRLAAGYDVVHSHENSWVGDVQGVHVMPVRYSRFHNGRGLGRRVADSLSPRWLAYLALESARYRARPGRRLVAASALIAEQIGTAYGDTAKCLVIPPGVALPAACPERIAAQSGLGLDRRYKYIILVANDPVRKGYRALLKAVPAMPADVRLLVVGGEGGTDARVLELAAQAGLRERVHAWPGQRDLTAFYAAADLCVFATQGDAFGMVPLEAMAHGLPVVLSPAQYCGFTSYVQDGVHALILKHPDDAAGIAAAVGRILREPRLYAGLQRQGLALAASLSWESVAASYADLYREVASELAGLGKAPPSTAGGGLA